MGYTTTICSCTKAIFTPFAPGGSGLRAMWKHRLLALLTHKLHGIVYTLFGLHGRFCQRASLQFLADPPKVEDLQKDLQDFVQEQRLMAGKLTEDLRSLGGLARASARAGAGASGAGVHSISLGAFGWANVFCLFACLIVCFSVFRFLRGQGKQKTCWEVP